MGEGLVSGWGVISCAGAVKVVDADSDVDTRGGLLEFLGFSVILCRDEYHRIAAEPQLRFSPLFFRDTVMFVFVTTG